MKTIKFTQDAIEKILSGRKTTTRRLMKECNWNTESQIAIRYYGNDVDSIGRADIPCVYNYCRFGKTGDILQIEGTDRQIEITRVYCHRFDDITKYDAYVEGYETICETLHELEICYPSLIGHNPWLWVLNFKLKEKQ